MRIWNLHLIEKFKRKHASSRGPMADWISKALEADWKTPTDVKMTFPSASFVKHLVIFNIGGNKYRLIAEIVYRIQQVIILKVGTHAEYDRWGL